MIIDKKFHSLNVLLSRVIQIWPEHKRFLLRRFTDEPQHFLTLSEQLTADILQICGDTLEEHIEGYRWMCQAINEEELHFRRSGQYRLNSFEDANRQVYQNPDVMMPYLRGILLSQVLWSNHSHCFNFYKTSFLQKQKRDYRHLEIGPGHGLFLSAAARDPACQTATGWDLSPSSLEHTAYSCAKLGVLQKVLLSQPDTRTDSKFDSLVLSEVLEHLEKPLEMLFELYSLTRKNGRAFINVPLNSPAPDHIYLFREPDEVYGMIEQAGYQIEETRCFPATGFTLEKARRLNTTISCAIIAHRTS